MIYIARNDEIKKDFNEQGYAQTELLPDSHDGSIRNYKCFLKAGSTVEPQLYADKEVIYMFGKGTGHITDPVGAYEICEEVSFYIPDFDRKPFAIHAYEDLEFIMAVVDMSEGDWEDYAHSHIRLPYWRPLSKCVKYDQDCKGPNTTSWHVLNSKQLGHVIVGVVRAIGEGTDEKGHPAVHQWNYCLGNADFELTVGDESTRTVAGDWSFVPAGPDHKLLAEPGKEVFYVWFEQFTRKDRNYIVTLSKDEVREDI